MGDLVIECHDFENAKNEIKEFSEHTKTELDIKKVSDKKGVGEWLGDAIFGGGIGFDHKVTGQELNELIVQIQGYLYGINNTQIKIIKEFGHVYNALEALDKDYIKAILVSIKATEKTSERIEATQEQIKKIVEDQRKTLEVLKKFKQKLDTYSHLGDIDKIWNDCQNWNKKISKLSDTVNGAVSVEASNAKMIENVQQSLKTVGGKVVNLDKSLGEQILQMEIVLEFVNELEKITHLKDIDQMWIALDEAHNSLNNICESMKTVNEVANKQQKEIEKILGFISAISEYEHLQDIDSLWNKTENHEKELSEINQQNALIVENVKKSHAEIAELRKQENNLRNIVENNDERIKKQQDKISELVEHKQLLLGIEHLEDIDELWNVNVANGQRITDIEKQEGETKVAVQKNKEILEATIAELREQNSSAVQSLTNKVKYAYMIAGGSLGLALIELIIILMRVI